MNYNATLGMSAAKYFQRKTCSCLWLKCPSKYQSCRFFYNSTLESPKCQNFDLKPDSPFNDYCRIRNFSIVLSWNCFRWLHIFRWLVRQSKIQTFGRLTLLLTILTYKENEAGDEESNPNASYQWNVLREKLVFDCWKYA